MGAGVKLGIDAGFGSLVLVFVAIGGALVGIVVNSDILTGLQDIRIKAKIINDVYFCIGFLLTLFCKGRANGLRYLRVYLDTPCGRNNRRVWTMPGSRENSKPRFEKCSKILRAAEGGSPALPALGLSWGQVRAARFVRRFFDITYHFACLTFLSRIVTKTRFKIVIPKNGIIIPRLSGTPTRVIFIAMALTPNPNVTPFVSMMELKR